MCRHCQQSHLKGFPDVITGNPTLSPVDIKAPGVLIGGPGIDAQLRRALSKTEPKIRRLLVKTWNAMQESIKYGDIESALVSGAIDQAQLDVWRQQYSKMITEELYPQYEALGKKGFAAIRSSLARAGSDLSWDQVGARMGEWIHAHGAELLADVTKTQTAAMKRLLQYYTVENPINPRDAARYIRPLVGLTDREATAVARFRSGLQSDGLSGDKVDRLVARYTARTERARALRIARTESATAFNRGHLSGVTEAVNNGDLQGNVFKDWLTAEDEKVCEFCNYLDGQTKAYNENFVGMDGNEFETAPAHPSCRCSNTYRVVKTGPGDSGG